MSAKTLLVACLAAIAWIGRAEAQGAAGKIPDITGAWERYRSAPGTAGAARTPDPLAPPQAPPPPLKANYLDEWRGRVQRAREADAKGQPLATNYTDCLPDGMPSMMGAMFPIEFLQSRGQVTVIEEAFTQVRRILLDRPQRAVDDADPSFYGYSVGRWEGDTLVVDTVGVKESVRFQNAPHSKDMRIKERIHLVAPDVLWDEITIEDPTTLERPWAVTYAYKRMPNYTLLEYICEDNREYADAQGLQKIRVGDK